jgi:hypothetical protein
VETFDVCTLGAFEKFGNFSNADYTIDTTNMLNFAVDEKPGSCGLKSPKANCSVHTNMKTHKCMSNYLLKHGWRTLGITLMSSRDHRICR